MTAYLSGDSKLALFADDSKLYRTLSSTSSTILQSDPNSLHRWSMDWNMSINTSKSLFLHMSRKRSSRHAISNYHFGSHCLQAATSTKDLGVIISSNPSWADHINKLRAKANKTLSLIKRICCKDITELETRKMSYLTLVRSQLEYD